MAKKTNLDLKTKTDDSTARTNAPGRISQSGAFRLAPEMLIEIHEGMLRGRLMEERLIRMYKQSQGYFWLGGPGEEAFNIPLGMLIQKGQGPNHDYLHFHYRQGATLLMMGLDPKDAMRQMANVASDPFSGGRNFASHYSIRKWNVVPVTSTIETQYLTSIGTAIAQKRHGGSGITIVTGGDAGTAEGDFASCLVWASRPGNELPLLIIVTNNQWGISTPAKTQHGDARISDRGRAFGIRSATIHGNDVEESYFALQEAMEYVRRERKPFLLEASVSRLYGHSSATGANFVGNEPDCLAEFEARLEKSGILSREKMTQLREAVTQDYLKMSLEVRGEALPDPSTIYDYTYAGQKGKYW